jgi:hypothetical protein
VLHWERDRAFRYCLGDVPWGHGEHVRRNLREHFLDRQGDGALLQLLNGPGLAYPHLYLVGASGVAQGDGVGGELREQGRERNADELLFLHRGGRRGLGLDGLREEIMFRNGYDSDLLHTALDSESLSRRGSVRRDEEGGGHLSEYFVEGQLNLAARKGRGQVLLAEGKRCGGQLGDDL